MINPVLIDLASEARAFWTVFVLQLSLTDQQYNDISTTFRNIKPETLLFTRRLREIEIVIDSGNRGNISSCYECILYPLTTWIFCFFDIRHDGFYLCWISQQNPNFHFSRASGFT